MANILRIVPPPPPQRDKRKSAFKKWWRRGGDIALIFGGYGAGALLTFGYAAHVFQGNAEGKTIVGFLAAVMWPFYWCWTLFDWVLK